MEYNVMYLDLDGEVEDILNSVGAEGWDLVFVIPGARRATFIFKRVL